MDDARLLESLSPDAVTLLGRSLHGDEVPLVVVHGSFNSAVIGTNRRLFVFDSGWLSVGGPHLLGWPYGEVRSLEVERKSSRTSLTGFSVRSGHDVLTLKFDAPVAPSDQSWNPCSTQLDGSEKWDWESDFERLKQIARERRSTDTPTTTGGETDRREVAGVTMASSGFPSFEKNTRCRLEFDEDKVAVYRLGDAGYSLAATIPLVEVRTLEVSAPSAPSKSKGKSLDFGSWSGSLLSATVDAVVPQVDRTDESVVHLSAEGKDLVLRSEEMNPEVMRGHLAPALARLSSAPTTGAHPTQARPDESRLEELKQLGELRASGVLTEDEFLAEKAKLLRGGDSA